MNIDTKIVDVMVSGWVFPDTRQAEMLEGIFQWQMQGRLLGLCKTPPIPAAEVLEAPK